MRAFALIAAGLAAIAAPASAGVLTFANNPTGLTVAPFGPAPSATPTYGQVFASPVAGTLQSFSFSLSGGVGQIRGAVGTWNGTANFTTGGGSPSTLWQSDLVASGPGTITFNPNVQIADLTRHVAYITVYNSPDATGSTTMLRGDNANEAALRYFVFDNGLGNPAGNASWSYFDTGVSDALFSFSVAVPEPAQWVMLIAGFGLVGAVARRRRSGLPLPA